jgi:hypothetical protein
MGHAIAGAEGRGRDRPDRDPAALADAVKEAEANDPKLLRARSLVC